MDLPEVATRLFAQPDFVCHSLVVEDLATWTKPHSVSLFHYVDDIMLTSDCTADLIAAGLAVGYQ